MIAPPHQKIDIDKAFPPQHEQLSSLPLHNTKLPEMAEERKKNGVAGF